MHYKQNSFINNNKPIICSNNATGLQLSTKVVYVMWYIFGLLGAMKLELTCFYTISHSISHSNESVSWYLHSANVKFDQLRHIPNCIYLLRISMPWNKSTRKLLIYDKFGMQFISGFLPCICLFMLDADYTHTDYMHPHVCTHTDCVLWRTCITWIMGNLCPTWCTLLGCCSDNECNVKFATFLYWYTSQDK